MVKINKKNIEKRMDYLFKISNILNKKDTKYHIWIPLYLRSIKELSNKTVLKIDKKIKNKFCKICYNLRENKCTNH